MIQELLLSQQLKIYDEYSIAPRMILITILMPVKNAAPFLEDCLDSIVKQSITHWELIAVDDHSSDDSMEILKSYAAMGYRIKPLKNNGIGVIMALRTAYKQARGNFITRMDADDIMAENKLELLHERLAGQGIGHLAVGHVKYFSREGVGEGYRKYALWLNRLTAGEVNFSDIYRECPIPSPCWMVAREDLDNIGAFDSDIYPEDYDLAFRFRKAGLNILGVQEEIHHWRDHPSRASRNDTNYADNRFAELKVKHFLDQDRLGPLPLVIWGAGRKGKDVARLFRSRGQAFRWVTDNDKKIGKSIYKTEVEGLDILAIIPRSQVIVCVSTFHDDQGVYSIAEKCSQHQYFYFF